MSFGKKYGELIHRFVRFLVVEKSREDEEAVKEVSMETVISVQEQLERGSWLRLHQRTICLIHCR